MNHPDTVRPNFQSNFDDIGSNPVMRKILISKNLFNIAVKENQKTRKFEKFLQNPLAIVLNNYIVLSSALA